MPTRTEGSLHFDFPTGWHAVKYDEEGGFYRSVITRHVQGIRGVDFVASPADNARLLFIEVKDCREDTQPEESLNNKLLETMQRKILGTLAGLVVAERMQEPTLRVLAMLRRRPPIEVVLFLVEPTATIAPTATGRKLRRVTQGNGRNDLSQKLTAILAPWRAVQAAWQPGTIAASIRSYRRLDSPRASEQPRSSIARADEQASATVYTASPPLPIS